VSRLARAALTAALHPVVAVPGYWVATAAGAAWAGLLGRGRMHRESGLLVADAMPSWAFGRGGTTIGAVFLTSRAQHADVIAHEAAHREQWRRFGLAFIPLYLMAGRDPLRNRFEIEAGLELGGYVPRAPAPAGRAAP
jgi:hypothetical protein